MTTDTPTSRLDRRLDSSFLELKLRLGTDENCYDVCITGLKRRELALKVTWCGEGAYEALKASLTSRDPEDDELRRAAHEACWPVVHRDRAKAFALAFRRVRKLFTQGKLPGASSAPAVRLETVEVRRSVRGGEGYNTDLPYDEAVLTEALMAVQHVFGVEVPPMDALVQPRVNFQQQQVVELERLKVRLEEDRDDARKAVQDELDKWVAQEEAAKLFKVGRRNGGRLMIDATRAADDGPVTEAKAVELLSRLFVGEPVDALYLYGSQVEDRPFYSGVEPWCRALASADRSTLTRWVVDSFDEPITRTASWLVGDITSVLERARALVSVFVVGVSYLSRLNHGSLESLTLMTDPMEAKTIKAVFGGGAPKLQSLALGLSYERAAAAAADEALVQGFGAAHQNLPNLTELHVAYPKDAAGVLSGLMESAAFSQLTTLSMSTSGGSGGKDQETALTKVVLARPEAFKHLEAFHLPALAPESYAQLAAAGVVVGAPHNAFDPNIYGWQAFMDRSS